MTRQRRLKKVPDQATNREDKRLVRMQAQQRPGKPCWRFSSVDLDGPFRWPKGKQQETEIVEKLHGFDSMTWPEIQGSSHHFLSPSSLSKMAKDRLCELDLEQEIDQLFSFHLQGRPRLIVIRHQDVAELLWYDPNHQVAPAFKKHT